MNTASKHEANPPSLLEPRLAASSPGPGGANFPLAVSNASFGTQRLGPNGWHAGDALDYTVRLAAAMATPAAGHAQESFNFSSVTHSLILPSPDDALDYTLKFATPRAARPQLVANGDAESCLSYTAKAASDGSQISSQSVHDDGVVFGTRPGSETNIETQHLALKRDLGHTHATPTMTLERMVTALGGAQTPQAGIAGASDDKRVAKAVSAAQLERVDAARARTASILIAGASERRAYASQVGELKGRIGDLRAYADSLRARWSAEERTSSRATSASARMRETVERASSARDRPMHIAGALVDDYYAASAYCGTHF